MASKTSIAIIVIGVVILGLYFMKRRDGFNADHPILDQVRENFARLNPKYATIPLRVGTKSYTENKSLISLCIQDPSTKKFYDMNTIMYVSLHELAHVVSKSVSEEEHNEEFRQNFAKLLERAAQLGIYNPNIPVPPTYCGLHQ
jgi:hypothetical protein